MQEKKTDILLESGTNEIEIMKFSVLGEYYGINVAKVREIMMAEKVKPMPHSHKSVEGFFKPRDMLITVINLTDYLFGCTAEMKERDLFIVTNFNKILVAFRVDSIEGISRISWQDIQKPDKTLTGTKQDGVATGIAKCEDKLITILDFEKIVAEIAPQTTVQISDVESLGDREINKAPVIVAEDSALLSAKIKEAFQIAGFTNFIFFNNGQEAWDYLSRIKNDSDIYDKLNLVITDIEMPEMDGHRLTKLIKTDDVLKEIPVIIFSSLINEQMMIKGKALGADEQLSKPEITDLIEAIDRQLGKFAGKGLMRNI